MCPAPSNSAIGIGERSISERLASGTPAGGGRGGGLTFTLRFIGVPGLFPVCRNPGDQRAILIEAFAGQHQSLVGNLIFANVFAVLAVAHFDDCEDAVQHAIEIQVTQPDNVVGQKRNHVVAEPKL